MRRGTAPLWSCIGTTVKKKSILYEAICNKIIDVRDNITLYTFDYSFQHFVSLLKLTLSSLVKFDSWVKLAHDLGMQSYVSPTLFSL